MYIHGIRICFNIGIIMHWEQILQYANIEMVYHRQKSRVFLHHLRCFRKCSRRVQGHEWI